MANNGVVNVFAGTTVYKPDPEPLAQGSPPYGGQTTIFSGATWAAGAVNAFSRNSNTVVNSGGTLNLQGFSQSLLNDGNSRNPFPTTTVTNAGLVQLGVPGVTPPGTTLTVNNYVGNGGIMAMNTFLGTDGSPSDKLVINGGTGTGQSSLRVTNAGGAGAQTVSDGILVVQAVNGATTTAGAFSLNGGSITAGAFDYFLFKGGASQGSQSNWYLRNEVIAPPTPDTPTPEPAPGTPPLPTPVPGAAPIPLFQPGVAVMSVVPSVARSLGLLTLGTFNERQGDQLLVRGGCSRETQDRLWNAGKSITGDENCMTRLGAWGRVFGQNTREHFAQGARPDFDGSFAGFQVGADLWRLESSNGHRDNIGFYVAQARASGSVHGSVDGFEGALAGHVDLDASSYGGYWTHLWSVELVYRHGGSGHAFQWYSGICPRRQDQCQRRRLHGFD